MPYRRLAERTRAALTGAILTKKPRAFSPADPPAAEIMELRVNDPTDNVVELFRRRTR